MQWEGGNLDDFIDVRLGRKLAHDLFIIHLIFSCLSSLIFVDVLKLAVLTCSTANQFCTLIEAEKGNVLLTWNEGRLM